jgi:hypothetical protein
MTASSLWKDGVIDAPDSAGRPTSQWEYLIVSLPEFQPPTHAPGSSDAIHSLNEEGDRGWEAVNMIALANGTVAVLFKRLAGPR